MKLFRSKLENFCLQIKLDDDDDVDSDFDKLLKSEWLQCMDNGGQFRYSLENVEFRDIPGSNGLFTEFCAERVNRRQAPYAFTDINHPFNDEVFNFTKIKEQEILFDIVNNSATVDDTMNLKQLRKQSWTLAINSSPIEVGHSLIVPYLSQCRNQLLTTDLFVAVLETFLLSHNKSFLAFYNTLRAFATVNHFHCHMLYCRKTLRIRSVDIEVGKGDCYVTRKLVLDGFVLQTQPHTMIDLISNAGKIISYFNTNGIPFSMVLYQCEQIVEQKDGIVVRNRNILNPTVFFFPRRPVDRDGKTYSMSPASIETTGYILCYDRDFFENATEQQVKEIYDQRVRHDDETLAKITGDILNLF